VEKLSKEFIKEVGTESLVLLHLVMRLTSPQSSQAMNGVIPTDLSLPGPNAFIPENLDVEKQEVAQARKVPALLRDSSLSRLWYKKDDRFWVPRANLFVALQS
jgi:secreted Zn-dependent insulinase-like peptidase